MRFATISILAIGVGLGACRQPSAQEAGRAAASKQATAAAPIRCEDLKSITVANTTIAGAEIVAAGAFKPPAPGFPGLVVDYSKMPAFCRVTGSIKPSADSDIRFELWLPAEGWNGRFMQTGNGGAAGSIVYDSFVDPLVRGYAVANTDTGHQGAGGDFTWALDHPEKVTDYAYRAVHELTIAGKAITTARYGRSPEKAYWNGCSTGGRQGLKEAQRFPDDYDAIIAGAPASNWSPLMSLSILIQRNIGPEGLGVDKLRILKEAAIAACDARDGVKDRVIADPGKCTFDPASTQCKSGQTGPCLSEKEVAAARRIYAGVVSKAGEIRMPGTGPGSEPLWVAYASPQFGIGTSYFRNLVARNPTWDPATFDVDRDLARAEQVDGGAHVAMNPDLSAFIAHGGKLITYHGTTDGLISYGNSVNYYRSVVAKLGEDAIKDRVKLYLIPGMDHCFGGEGAFAIDWLTALEDWTEKGKTPGAVPAMHPAMTPGPPGAPPSRGKAFTRLVCAYPQVARYKGSGDETDAANFACVAPS
jgi:feruloyl esterase